MIEIVSRVLETSPGIIGVFVGLVVVRAALVYPDIGFGMMRNRPVTLRPLALVLRMYVLGGGILAITAGIRTILKVGFGKTWKSLEVVTSLPIRPLASALVLIIFLVVSLEALATLLRPRLMKGERLFAAALLLFSGTVTAILIAFMLRRLLA